MCKLNAEHYNIDIGTCEFYIRDKFLECKLELPNSLPKIIDNTELGRELISEYFTCISAYPHCQGHEIKDAYEAEQYCNSL